VLRSQILLCANARPLDEWSQLLQRRELEKDQRFLAEKVHDRQLKEKADHDLREQIQVGYHLNSLTSS